MAPHMHMFRDFSNVSVGNVYCSVCNKALLPVSLACSRTWTRPPLNRNPCALMCLCARVYVSACVCRCLFVCMILSLSLSPFLSLF
jgi:hypothetical protein